MTIREIIQRLEDEKKQLKDENKMLKVENMELKCSKRKLMRELLSLKRLLEVKEEHKVEINEETGNITIDGGDQFIYPVDIQIPEKTEDSDVDVPEPPKPKRRSRKKTKE